MAPLKVIGAGLDRTGTDGLSVALDILGYKTHHMRHLYFGQGDPDLFKKAYEQPENPIDWNAVYQDFDAAIGTPSVIFLERLMKQYPEAKIILTVRDPDAWYESVKSTIYQMTHQPAKASTPKHILQIREMAHAIVLDGSFGKPAEFLNAQAMKEKFLQHNAWVRKHVPADKLLVMELGKDSQWDKLCAFLGQPIPEVSYPKTNSKQELLQRVKARDFDKKNSL
ncbi:P-loop containing nucleoside triphosphate hydrolase protein [Phascolomyces articulosus]|uniref:P-loop containing nucleoside triphosphate hydrolase protein n=1 Tax=Phascolomyces articulosus TaxID=60185 RepID=A0AAD5PB57_9FUNG|nr:P-loop containing nucleoside triphosphate hydrolase protein [Phascolomyces articulosus]